MLWVNESYGPCKTWFGIIVLKYFLLVLPVHKEVSLLEEVEEKGERGPGKNVNVSYLKERIEMGWRSWLGYNAIFAYNGKYSDSIIHSSAHSSIFWVPSTEDMVPNNNNKNNNNKNLML